MQSQNSLFVSCNLEVFLKSIILSALCVFLIACTDGETVGVPGVSPNENDNVPGKISWTLTDSCGDGVATQVRFWEQTNSGFTGRHWPGGDQVYILGEGDTATYDLSCSSGTTACLGARPRSASTNNYWGVDIDGSESCSDCCIRCGFVSSANLRCNRDSSSGTNRFSIEPSLDATKL